MCAKAEGESCKGLWNLEGDCASFLTCHEVATGTDIQPGLCGFPLSVNAGVDNANNVVDTPGKKEVYIHERIVYVEKKEVYKAKSKTPPETEIFNRRRPNTRGTRVHYSDHF